MWKYKNHVPNHQPEYHIISYNINRGMSEIFGISTSCWTRVLTALCTAKGDPGDTHEPYRMGPPVELAFSCLIFVAKKRWFMVDITN